MFTVNNQYQIFGVYQSLRGLRWEFGRRTIENLVGLRLRAWEAYDWECGGWGGYDWECGGWGGGYDWECGRATIENVGGLRLRVWEAYDWEFGRATIESLGGIRLRMWGGGYKLRMWKGYDRGCGRATIENVGGLRLRVWECPLKNSDTLKNSQFYASQTLILVIEGVFYRFTQNFPWTFRWLSENLPGGLFWLYNKALTNQLIGP